MFAKTAKTYILILRVFVKPHLPMVSSNESVRLYSYKHFSSVAPSSPPLPPPCFSSPQPSKLAFMFSTSHLLTE